MVIYLLMFKYAPDLKQLRQGKHEKNRAFKII